MTITELFNMFSPQVNSEMTSIGSNWGFLVILDNSDQDSTGESDPINYFLPNNFSGGRGIDPIEDHAPRNIVTILILGGKKTPHSKMLS